MPEFTSQYSGQISFASEIEGNFPLTIKTRVVDTVLSTDSAGNVVDSWPVRRQESGPTQDAAGRWVDPVQVEDDRDAGYPVRYVDGLTTTNSAGRVIPVTPIAGGSPIIAYPVVTGNAIEGQTLTASNGTWAATPTSYTYQWMRADILVGGDVPILLDGDIVYVGSEETISGATASTYVVRLGDAGYDDKDYVIWCVVTAHYDAQAYSAAAEATGPVTPLYHQSAGVFFLRLDALATLPDATRRMLISNVFQGLDNAGSLSKIGALHIKAAHSQAAALQNWIGDYANAAVLGSLTFTTDRGFTSAGAGRITLGVPLASIPHYTRDDCHIGAWALTAGTAGRSLVGTATAANFRIRNNEGASERLVRVNTTTSLMTDDNVTTGHVVGVRQLSTHQRSYRNGAGEASALATSGALDASNVLYLSSFGTDSDAQLAIAHLGGGLTAQQVSDTYNVFHTYLQALGAAA